ncbi:hypothetical protein BGX38DRAFT_1230447 [Terfezia claveryi]|nr:hypothetical protein BGX38DRAFT_1230447 [Terfezia claveryi]
MSWFTSLLSNVFYKYPKRLFLAVKDIALGHPCISKVIVIVLCTAGAAAFGGILAAIGFTTAGIVAGSLAAAWHSNIGVVSAGSLFATLQSLAATGLIYTIGAALGALVSAIMMYFSW